MKVQVNARNRAHHFEAGADENILYAGLGKGIDLPYECGSGTCGTCKARLISGEIEDGWPQAPGRKYLRGGDGFLMCQSRAKTDVVIETAAFVHPMPPATCVPASFGGRITAAALLTADVMHLVVELSGTIDFDAGQFVMVEVPGVSGRRGWSMVNYERQARALEFVVKQKPGGRTSDWLFGQDRVGSEIALFGPLGRATFYPGLGRNLLCVAGGSGIAGMMSILKRSADESYFSRHQGDIFFGVRTMKDAFFLDTFSSLRKQCGSGLRVTVALSEEEVPASAAGQYPELAFDTGLVHEVAGRHMQGRYQNIRAYLAGPPPAVDACIRMLLMQARLTADNIRYDKFS